MTKSNWLPRRTMSVGSDNLSSPTMKSDRTGVSLLHKNEKVHYIRQTFINGLDIWTLRSSKKPIMSPKRENKKENQMKKNYQFKTIWQTFINGL